LRFGPAGFRIGFYSGNSWFIHVRPGLPGPSGKGNRTAAPRRKEGTRFPDGTIALRGVERRLSPGHGRRTVRAFLPRNPRRSYPGRTADPGPHGRIPAAVLGKPGLPGGGPAPGVGLLGSRGDRNPADRSSARPVHRLRSAV